MDFSRNLSALFPGAHSIVLQELLRTPKQVTGRQLAMQLVDRLGKSRVSEVMQDLVRQGLVEREILGAAHLYSINKKHLCYELLNSLTQPVDLLLDLVTKQIGRWSPKPIAVVLFGSIAKGTAKPDSDIDLLIVRPRTVSEDDDAWQDQLFRLTLAVQKATGSELNYLDYSQAELTRMAKSGARLAKELSQSGLVAFGKLDLQFAKAG
jgi:predicted nucleotidyltransferase